MRANDDQGEVLSYRIIVLFSTGVKRGQWQQMRLIYAEDEKKTTNKTSGNDLLFA
jgi:hypothetical protein